MSKELKVPSISSPYLEEEAREFITRVRDTNTVYSQDFLHSCYQNVIFDYNIQWVVFDTLTQQWRPRANKKWQPKPVTNVYSAVLRPLVSSLAGTEPILHFSPTSDSPDDVATAEVANRCLEIAKEEVKIAAIRPRIARWVTLTGNAWLISGYDQNDRDSMVPEQLERCVTCGNTIAPQDVEAEGGCPWCNGNDQESEGFIPAFDEMNAPMMGSRPRGSLYTELATVFEMEYDHECDDFYKSMYAVRVRSREKEWVKAKFGLSNEELGSSRERDSDLIQRRYLESLAYMSPVNYQLFVGRSNKVERTVVTDLWINPTAENPEGLYCVLVGDIVVFADKYRYHDALSAPGTPKPMRPITHFGYQYAAGRVAYRTPADDLVSKQRTRNELESIKLLHSRRAANSIIMIPDGANVSKQVGEEGLILRYTAMSGVPAPQRQPGLDTPRFIDNWTQLIDAEMEKIAGSVDVLRGEAPASIEAYSAIQFLEAKANQALAEPRVIWHIGWAEWSKQILGIFKEYAVDARDSALRGENGSWAVKKFSAADLRGGVRILPETSTQAPSSMIAKRAAYEQGVRIGLANLADPQERYRGWEMLGLPEVMKDMDLDTQHAARENDTFVGIFVRMEEGEPPPVNPVVDNHMIHMAIHRRFALTEEFKTLGPFGMQMFYGHMANHQHYLILAQQAAQGGPNKPMGNEGKMAQNADVQPENMARSEGGSASQPERANEQGKPRPEPRKGDRAQRLDAVKKQQNVP